MLHHCSPPLVKEAKSPRGPLGSFYAPPQKKEKKKNHRSFAPCLSVCAGAEAGDNNKVLPNGTFFKWERAELEQREAWSGAAGAEEEGYQRGP